MQIMKETKLYVQLPNNKRPRSIKEFLLWFFKGGTSGTYYNKNITNIQCRRNAQRSFYDIYLVTKTYYPSLTIKKFAKRFKEVLLIKNDSCNILGRYCASNKNIMFRHREILNRYPTDPNYFFVVKIGSTNNNYHLANNYYTCIKRYGFKDDRFTLDNLNILFNDN